MRDLHWPGDPARPALALHCAMGNAASWGPVAERLAGMVDLRAFDAPGHGRAKPWDGRDLHGQVTRMATARMNGPVDLIGHSLGATVALRIAARAPEAVRSLTLIEPVIFAAAPEAPLREMPAMAAAVAEGDMRAATAAFIDEWGDAPFDSLPAPVQDRLTAQLPMVLETNAALVADSAGILRPGGLEAIAAPVALIRGGDSPPAIAAIAAALGARLPDAVEGVVAGARHMLPLTHPAEVAGHVAANLRRA